MYGIIYMLTNTATGLGYVGQTTQSLNARFSGHVAAANVGELSLIANAIRTYGSQAFKKEVLRYSVRATDLDSVETLFINLYNTRHPNEYNERMP